MKIIPQIKFTSVLQKIRNLEKRNKAFHELTDEGKRLEIAWDCLQLVVRGMISAGRNYWDGAIEVFADNAKNAKIFQQRLNNLPKGCEVCQRGGLMLSQIRLGNSIDPRKDGDYCDGNYKNIKGFNTDDFKIMEDIYMGWENAGMPHQHSTNAMLANICCNILVNGNFNPKDKTDYLKIVK